MEAGKHSVNPDVDITNVEPINLAFKSSYIGFEVG